VEVREADERGRREVWIGLDRKASRYRCSGCGQLCARYHDTEERELRDLPILCVAVRLFLWRFRAACSRCGPRLEALEWLEPRSRVTRRMAEDVARAWEDWLPRAMESGIAPLKTFARNLAKRMAYGFRYDAYFFLQIRAAFPGVLRRTHFHLAQIDAQVRFGGLLHSSTSRLLGTRRG